ncbi:unnamed protein product [Parnassius mnemosyne]|uniref:Uncharacterized protein n=2 Tax=Parnassius mnemosyne TaxID=213953 RepID=A0AAV1LMB7_9NEOP
MQIIIPILKPDKNPSDGNSYRPIALSSTLCKIMEHLIKNRLEWFVENKGLLAKTQFGFRKGLSTLDSLSVFTSDIRSAFSREESVGAVFLDVSSAYDNVVLPLLKEKMFLLDIPHRITRIIFNLLSVRSICIRVQGKLLPPRQIWRGLPQGSVLSPILFNIYTHNLEHSVNSFCKVLQYADDLTLYYSSKNFTELSYRLNSALFYLNNWLTNNGLSLSPTKSRVVIFSRKRFCPNISISVQNQIIPTCDNVKFLGVFLDSKMTGIPHLTFIAQKCEKNVNILRSLTGVWWGSHPYCLKLLYNALIRSHFDYGTFLLEPCNKQALNLLDKIQLKCLRIILGAMKSSPSNALQVECGEPPLYLRRQYLADRFIYRIFQISSHPLLSKLHSLNSGLKNNNYWTHKDVPCILKSYQKILTFKFPIFQSMFNPLFVHPFEALCYHPPVILDFGVTKNSPVAQKKFLSILREKWEGWLTLFTDASKLSENSYVGSAVWIPKYKIILNFKNSNVTSIFTGEAVAILEAILFIEAHKINKCIVFTDSYSSLQSISSNPFRSKSKFPIIFEIKGALYRCFCQGLNLKLAWLPSHSGIRDNEFVDSLAKQASTSGTLMHHITYTHDLISLAKIHQMADWNSLWKKTQKSIGKYYAELQPDIPSKPWFFKFRNGSKHSTSVICRIRLGHTCTPVFLAKLRIKDSSICECGLDEGTIDHKFFNCPNLSVSLYDYLPNNIPRPVNLKSLLNLVFTPFVQTLLDFISINNIKL